MKSDIEIANAYQGISIFDLAKRLGIHDYLEPYGKWKGKIDLSILDRLKEKKRREIDFSYKYFSNTYGGG